MDFELRAAKAKLEKEQKERKDRAKAKLERERKAREAAVKQREAIEAAASIKRIDAAHAQLIADQQMDESRLVGKGVMFCRVLEAVQYQGYGDKIKLPQSCFSELSDQGALDKGPMYFRLSKQHSVPNSEEIEHQNQGTIHSGVLEFTAPDGFVELPPHVWSNLYSQNSPDVPLVEVRYVGLPKGTYARLQPDRRGFSDIPNHKAVLETGLRQHATLSQGDILTVNHGEISYKLQVLELKPATSVSVLETDIEVDIEGSDSTSEETNRNVLVPLEIGKAESGVVLEGEFIYYKVTIDSDNSGIISSGNSSVEVKLEMDNEAGDIDLYVSKHPLIFPTQHQHEWSSHDIGSKVLIISPKTTSPCVGTYSIGVFGFKGVTKYKISVGILDNGGSTDMDETIISSVTAVDANSVECRNCKHYIPSRTISLHEAYCARNNVVCQHVGCGVVLRKGEAANHVHCEKCARAFQQWEIEKHMKVFHEPLHCSCGVILEKEAMVEHQSSVCPFRLVTCQFCGDMVPAGNTANDVRDRMKGLSEHESLCGSRTAPCDSCGRTVMLKDMDIHRVVVHQKN